MHSFVGWLFCFFLRCTWKTAARRLSALLSSVLFCTHVSSNTFNVPRYRDETGVAEGTAFAFFFNGAEDRDL